ncbi:aspartic peptidase domain-containing protein [Gongronella butleri]|nr:aspartic peptidase domain-containing protein [Gongronella butleri]
MHQITPHKMYKYSNRQRNFIFKKKTFIIMVRLSLALVAAAFISSTLAAPISSSGIVTLPISRASSKPNWSQAVQNDISRALSLLGGNQDAGSSFSILNKDTSYVASVIVGDQTFNLIVDSGSSNLWVGANTKYVPSATSMSTGQNVSVSYGSGGFNGTEYTDSVTLGPGFTILQQSVGVASSSKGLSQGIDGIIGIGPEILTNGTVTGEGEIPTVVNNAYKQGLISEQVVGISFAPINDSSTSANNGEMTLGGVDASKYTGDLIYTPITTAHPAKLYWGIDITAVNYGQTVLQTSTVAGIVDTGTTLIQLGTDIYNAFANQIPGATIDKDVGLLEIPASSYPNLSNVSFTIGGAAFSLSPAQYIMPQNQIANFGGKNGSYYSWISDMGSNDAGLDMILGQKFLENFYSVYDTTNNRVGLAVRA